MRISSMLSTDVGPDHGRTLQGLESLFQVSSKCSRQPHLSFASRGVRSRAPEEEVAAPTKVTTIPLLSPTTESELLKEPWVFPSAKNAPLAKEEDSREFPIWEENFQDLSSWCMDPFQGQYDFPIGESATLKILGTKYEGDCASTSEEGGVKELTGVTDEDKWSLKMDPTEAFEHADTASNAMLPTLQPSAELKQELSAADCSGSNSWLSAPRSSPAEATPAASAAATATATATATMSPSATASATTTSAATLPSTATASTKSAATATWSKQNGTDASATFHPGYHIDNLDLDDACPTPFDSAESQRETWDVLHTVEPIGSDTFDLLSYLCDDEMRSCGSTSADSVIATKPKASAKTAASSTNTSKAMLKGGLERRNDEPARLKLEERLSAAVSASSSEISVLPFRRSERTRAQTVVSQPEASCTRERRERRGKKRYIESDSDDQMSTTSSYRESREKNNEASRKSRMNKKAKENEMALRAVELERDNRILKMKVEELEKLVTSMRNALLRSALKKEF